GLLDLDAGAVDRLEADEVPPEPEREVLDLTYRRLPREGEDGVLLGVGRDDVGVLAGQVDVLEVAGQGDADREVLEAVAVTVAGDRDHPHLGLAVLVGAEDHAHAGSMLSTARPRAARLGQLSKRVWPACP